MAAPVYHAGAAFCGWISFADDVSFAALKSWPGRTTVHGGHDVGGRKTGMSLLASGETSECTFAIKMLNRSAPHRSIGCSVAPGFGRVASMVVPWLELFSTSISPP